MKMRTASNPSNPCMEESKAEMIFARRVCVGAAAMGSEI
jgi:hypothetical protein